ncbi:acyl-CoA-binding protein [Deinococcus hopiensis]|uniref:Acyl-CoA-binding protein n=1 Tax=Deinococcus hopiensis KR-140 TaxID=695939 RepID=A0A1W1VAU9_9DEIO|nr:acyl-CoA-binding protein [Deinococcus hopiensis]SMB90343.1 Acyl-CoA-binding protein [Deinococcus hopiensis KR-140]
MTSGPLQQIFEQAQQDVQGLSSRPGNDVLLKLYALYKQGTAGDVTGKRPGGFDFVGGAKYDAWAGVQGLSQEDAQREYVALVETLKARG